MEAGLAQLEAEGQILRGRFSPDNAADDIEWCNRRVLARIHRLTIGRLRREIEPVTTADFMRFLFRWQHLAPGSAIARRRWRAARDPPASGIRDFGGGLGIADPAARVSRDIRRICSISSVSRAK